MRAGALLAFLVLLVALGGCGGGGDSETTAAPGAPAGPASMTQGQGQGEEAEAGDEGQEAKAPPQGPAEPNPPIASERTPGSKAVAPEVPVTEGGDNSIQAFGTEAQESEAEQATVALKAYLDARASKDWPAACAAASEEFREQLEALVERAKATSKEAQKPKGCAETLELIFGKAPRQALEEAAQVNRVLSFRVREDGYAYLIYEDATGKAKFIAMASEDGAWKVNVPEPEAFNESQGESSQ